MIDNNLSPDARAILEAGRDLDSPGDLERARVRRMLLAKIAAGGTVLGASTAAASGAVTTGAAVGSSAALALPFAKVIIPLAIVIAGGLGGTVAWRVQRAMTPPAAITAAAPVAKAAPVAPEIQSTMPSPVVQHAAPAHRVHVAAPVRDEANRLPEEMALLAASNAELRRGDAARALALLDDYDRRYPAGVLREEVLATRVIARCQIGLAPDAAARHAADTFLRRHPASPLASRVRSSCAR